MASFLPMVIRMMIGLMPCFITLITCYRSIKSTSPYNMITFITVVTSRVTIRRVVVMSVRALSVWSGWSGVISAGSHVSLGRSSCLRAHSSCISGSINTIFIPQIGMYIRINMWKTDFIYLRIWCDSVTLCQRGHFLLTHPVHI